MTDDYEKTYNTFNEVAQKAMNRFYRACLDKTRDEMSKIEVTDEMEQRFCDYVNTHEGCTYRAALEAALNPPAEPEVPVSYEMMVAGMNAHGFDGFEKLPDRDAGVFVAKIYRAMRALGPKAGPFVAKAVPAPGQPWVKNLHSERRKDDPKRVAARND